MSKKSIIILAVGVLLLIAVVVFSQIFVSDKPVGDLAPPEMPGEVVYVPFPVEITLDGELSDWEGVPVSQVIDEEAADPAENGSFTFSVAADEEYFYVTMQMPDQNIIAGKHGSDFWNEDSFEFYINASGDLEAISYAEKIFQININAADIGNTDPDGLTITGVFSRDQVVKGFVFKTEDGWGFEAAVPLEGLLEPAHGLEIGFQAQINGASQLDRDTKIIWSKADTADQSWNYPYLYGRALFYEVGRTDIPESVGFAPTPTRAPTPIVMVIPELISVNQVGYFVDGKKMASLATSAATPLGWKLLDSGDQVVLEGETIVKGDDSASGDHIHLIDFSGFNTEGSDYRIAVDALESASFDISDQIYSQLKYDSLAYFYHNRSGIPIEAEFVGEGWARSAGHLTDSEVTCFRGEDSSGKSYSGCDYTLDASGGWYDAGDYGKYVVNGGISVWTLMNLYERFPEAYPDGSLTIPENDNGIPDILDEARWEMEFLLRMQVPADQPSGGMVHHKMHDRTWAALPLAPPTEFDNDNQHSFADAGRYLYVPSTAATLNLSATAAQCARIWEDLDAEFAARCLTAAETAWQAALANPNRYMGNIPGDGGGNYDDQNVSDEFYWAAAELFITTGDEEYLTFLLDSPHFADADQFDWGATAPLGTISLAVAKIELPEEQTAELESSIFAFADEMMAIQDAEGYGVLIDGDYPWGSNGLILNNMLLMSIAHDLSGEGKYLDAVRLSMDYILGRNPMNKCYISGYGEYPMEHPHHRFWANDIGKGFPPPPPGAVSGGPNSNPTDSDALDAGVMDEAPSKRYVDLIGSYSTNEVTINWNAPLAWVVTFLDAMSE